MRRIHQAKVLPTGASWAWKGRTLGRIECLNDRKFIHIHAFEKPFITTTARKIKIL